MSDDTGDLLVSTVLPAEWAPQAKVMLTWPRADGDFSRWFEAVERNFIALAVAITRYEPLQVNVAEDAPGLAARLVAVGVDSARLEVYQVPNNDVWARDHGPITVLRDGAPVHLDFHFNGWGGKFEAGLDDALTGRLITLDAWEAQVESVDFVLEGGAIESDGAGTLLTTSRCLLAPTRNPAFDRAGIEALLADKLGIQRFLWLEHGDLIGDDTDGHIDTLARFCDPLTIAYQGCTDRDDPQFDDLAAMANDLRAFRTASGEAYRLVELPMPTPMFDEEGVRLPAGYANFLIVNGAVLMPFYNISTDVAALEVLRGCFPDREVVGIDCSALIRQYGSLHCVTMQFPLAA